MKNGNYRHRALKNHPLEPETLMMGYGYSPGLSEGALKPPIFLTSTFVFETAQQGKDFFDLTAGRRKPREGERSGLVYSRFNNPNFEILEDRLALWDGCDHSAVFGSGMGAIATVMLAFLKPGDVVLHSRPLYGGTETLIRNQLGNLNIEAVGFTDGIDRKKIAAAASEAMAKGRLGLVMLETPANPTNGLVDLRAVAEVVQEVAAKQGHRPPIAVDNTLMGPIYQKPLKHGADLAIYSLTKYAGGHSDLVAGGVSGTDDLVRRIRLLRGALGTQLDPHSCWMLLRSLETLSIRTERANENARKVAAYLRAHKKIKAVHYLGFLEAGDPRKAVYDRQCVQPGSTFAFEVKGGEAEAFALLDKLEIMKLAVSLGGTETLISHPASTTHSGVARDLREEIGLTEALIRISVGIENADDLIADLENALG
jgi:methionine-gamma-lyase